MELLRGTPILESRARRIRFGQRDDSPDVPDPPAINLTWYSKFSSLPPELQAIVMKHVKRKALFVLCLVNKHFYQLSIPEVYSRVDLFCHYVSSGWCGTGLLMARDGVKRKQNQFCSTIKVHPELAAWAQTLLWGRHEKIWDVLALMPGLRHIRMEGIKKISEPSKHGTAVDVQGPERFPWSVISCLETISASGSYVAGGLSGILVNAPRLSSLSLTGGAREEPPDGGKGPGSIVPVLDACISLPQGLPNLRWLELERYVFINNEGWTEPEGPALQAWYRFLSRFGGQLEHLILRLEKYESIVKFEPEAAFNRNLFPLFTARTFVALKTLTLKGFNLSVDNENTMRRFLPSEVVITKTHRELPSDEESSQDGESSQDE